MGHLMQWVKELIGMIPGAVRKPMHGLHYFDVLVCATLTAGLL